jgi:hypothetical protein
MVACSLFASVATLLWMRPASKTPASQSLANSKAEPTARVATLNAPVNPMVQSEASPYGSRQTATLPSTEKSTDSKKNYVNERSKSIRLELPTEMKSVADRHLRPTNPFESDLPIQHRSMIDDLVFARMAELNIQPAKRCSDEVFLRRVYLDTLGTLPTIREVKEFLEDDNSQKRALLVDRLLDRPEYADYQAMKWCDILRVKAEFPINLWPNAAQAYHRWIRASIKGNRPFDEFARELLTASGSNFRTPQVNFYRAMQSKEPKSLAQAVALTFLGARAEKWPADRLEQFSLFFSQVGYKPTGEWKEEIVYYDPRKRIEKSDNPKVSAAFPDGTPAQIPAGKDPREVFADWLVDDHNPWFARTSVNRVWYWLLGRGIVDPPDDIRSDNPASNLTLLNQLAKELIDSQYDLKHLYRVILQSETYQLASIPQSNDSKAGECFAFYPARRLDAEVLIDAICQLTKTTETYTSFVPEPYSFLPENQRAIALPDGSISSSFLELFGRPPRDTGLESERNNRLTAAQALHLLNSNHLRNKLKQGRGIRDLIKQSMNSTETAETLYLAILSRRPTDNELQIADSMCDSNGGELEVAWALINSDEFLYRH